MKIDRLPAGQLSAELSGRWHAILAQTPHLAGPYFRPEFTAAVAAVRDDVEIAVLEDAGQVVGFFPYQRTRWNVAQPVGGRLSDYQGVIAPADVAWDPAAILTACRLKAWEFDHQLVCQGPMQPLFAKTAASPVIDMTGGHESWLEGRKAARDSVKEALRKVRKLQRESQSVRFVWHTTDPAVFHALLAWKSAQFARTGAIDLFRRDWIVTLLDRLRTTDQPHLAGVLSALFVDDKLIAAHLGLRSGSTLHSWFPVYDPEQSRRSPGLVSLLMLAEQAAARGVTRIDFGKGSEDYKLALASTSVEVAEGGLDRRPLAGALGRGWTSTRDWIKRSPFRQPARVPLHWLRRLGDWLGRGPLSPSKSNSP